MEKEIIIRIKLHIDVQEAPQEKTHKDVFEEVFNKELTPEETLEVRPVKTKRFYPSFRHGSVAGDRHEDQPLSSRKKLAVIICHTCSRSKAAWRVSQKYCSRKCYKNRK